MGESDLVILTDALDALPFAANSSPVLAGTSTDSHQADKSTSASEVHIPGISKFEIVIQHFF